MHTHDHGPGNMPTVEEASRLKVAAGVVAILLGGFGIHKFILGCTGAGLVMLLVTVLSFGFLSPIMVTIGIVEGIVYLTRSDQMFLQDYVVNKRSWF